MPFVSLDLNSAKKRDGVTGLGRPRLQSRFLRKLLYDIDASRFLQDNEVRCTATNHLCKTRFATGTAESNVVTQQAEDHFSSTLPTRVRYG